MDPNDNNNINNTDTQLTAIDDAEEQRKDDELNKQKQEEVERNAPFLQALPPDVEVHPLVLLSVVDHFARANAKVHTKRRVAGIMLGTVLKQYDKPQHGGGYTTVLDVNNCFAVPFDEDHKNPSVWFFDTNYAEDMFRMFKKVLPKVRVVGWYSTGPTICSNDLDLHLLIARRFNVANPIYCIVNTDPSKKDVPVLSYATTEGREGNLVEFKNVPTSLGVLEAEDIGVEHLLRDLTDTTITSLSTRIAERQQALNKLASLLGTIEEYLEEVVNGTLPYCEDILSILQELVNLLPMVAHLKKSESLIVAANDQAMATFVAAVTRCVSSLYEVILNRRRLVRELKRQQEEEEKQKKKKEEEEEEKKKKEQEKAEGKEGDASAAAASTDGKKDEASAKGKK